MKLKIFSFLVAGAYLLAPSFAFAESIGAFSAQIRINPNATLAVSELITYDFGAMPHHGIYRDIPYHYNARGGNYNVRIAVSSVTDEQGNPYPYSVSQANGSVRITIGDPNRTVTGTHAYAIAYTVARAINFFSDRDELYWNVTGNDWQVPMSGVSAQVMLPKEVAAKDLQLKCFAGQTGSLQPCGGTSYRTGIGGTTSEVDFSQEALNAAEGLTVVVGLPKGIIAKPSAGQNFIYLMEDNWVLALPLFTLLGMLWLWYKKGRDPLGFSTIVPQYEAPEGLTPTEVGTIVDERADNQDVSAEIIDLAVKGYIKITRLQEKILFFNSTDYQLDMLKDGKDLPNQFQRTLMDSLFSDGLPKVVISQLKNKFYTDLKDIKDEVYDSVVLKGYFAKNPESIRNWYATAGAIFVALGLFFGIHFGFYAGAAVVISGIIILVFSRFMAAHTQKGAAAKQYILGLKLYLSVAEKDRIRFFNAPEKTPERFEKLLPYAMVLGVEEQWAKQFEDLYKTPPSWYSDPTGSAFSAGYLVGSLHSFSATANTDFSAAPSSAGGGGSGLGGGGFSGGGFGGGGGGSW